MKSRDAGLNFIVLGFFILMYSILGYLVNSVVNTFPGLILSLIFI